MQSEPSRPYSTVNSGSAARLRMWLWASMIMNPPPCGCRSRGPGPGCLAARLDPLAGLAHTLELAASWQACGQGIWMTGRYRAGVERSHRLRGGGRPAPRPGVLRADAGLARDRAERLRVRL